ncbi:MAG: AgmX/PglI C-terminal domain-containing protein [Polyangiaceae bacterium]|nr:AgmX/PglI C-terminal domain-containing protein [Polyangiaceae bacterium]
MARDTSTRQRWLAATIAAVVLLIGAWRFGAGGVHRSSKGPAPARDEEQPRGRAAALDPDHRVVRDDSPGARANDARAGAPRAAVTTSDEARRTAQIRQALQDLAEAGAFPLWREAPRPPVPSATADTMPLPEPGLHNQADGGLGKYLRDRVHTDFMPLASQCYESALAQNPALAGSVTIRFTIVGDPKIGAVVESADLDDKSEITDPMFKECMQESMMAVNFGATPEGMQQISSTFTMRFAPSSDGR